MQLITFVALLALAAPLMAADTAPGLGSDAGNASDAAKDAGGKAGTENGTGKGTENTAGAAKAGGTGDAAATADTANSDPAGREVELDTLPAAVKSAVAKEAAAEEISTIRQRTDAGKTRYDVDVKRAGKTETVSFDEKGTKLEKAARAK
ncbi:MAG TPA: hypothetical protein VEL07_09195 [Planctomycetota bacterium]|nr:hypothetical protein [Planctomycetota bacterium]